jgi:hypothetical protein
MFSSVLVFLPLTSFGVRASKNICKQLVPEVTCLTICVWFSQHLVCEISSSHGGEYEVQICLLGCTAV